MPVQPAEAAPSAYAYPLLLKQLLHTPLATAPDQEIVHGARRHSYREFDARIHRLGHALGRLGVGAGATVAVMDWDSHRYLECFFAVPMLGAVLETINVRLAPEQILYTLNHARADVLLAHADFAALVERLRPQLATVKTFVLLADGDATPPPGFAGEYEALLDASPAGGCDFADFDENTRATTFYTTGTTGLPKGVHFSHRQLVLHTLGVAAALALAPRQGSFHRDDVYMPLTPMFHVHAWGLPYVATLAGVKQVYPGRYVPDAILALIARERVTFSHCVPTILQMLLAAPASRDVDLSTWKVVIGGAALPSGLAQTARERGIDVFAGYGMSETGPVLTLAQLAPDAAEPDDALATRIVAGRPIPLVELRVVDPAMQPLPRDGTPGEVVVRAPWLTQGYRDDANASAQLWRGGWLHTQDVGRLDADGYLHITDRLKDVIKSGGEWISSLELEELIGRHPDVAESAVIGVPDAEWGERPLALVVPKPGAAGRLDADAIRAHVRAAAEQGAVSRHAVPDRVEFVDALPRTSVGKLDKRAMREQRAAGSSA